MKDKILVTAQFYNDEFASAERQQGMENLSKYGELVLEKEELHAEDAQGVVASVASSSLYTDAFYEAATDLRIIARWGVGFDKVNVEAATRHGVLITVTPVHMDTVAEYAITQWLATLKRVYTLNRLSHGGDFSIIRTYEAQGSVLGLYGCGRIGQEVAQRARPLLGENGRLLIYDSRPDIGEIAARSPGGRLTHGMNVSCNADLFNGWGEAVVAGRISQDLTKRYNTAMVFKRAQGQGDRIARIDYKSESWNQETFVASAGKTYSTSLYLPHSSP